MSECIGGARSFVCASLLDCSPLVVIAYTTDQESDSVDRSYLDAFLDVETNVTDLQGGDLERKLSKADQMLRFKHVAEFFRLVRHIWVCAAVSVCM
jgi:hypothetical protein